MPETTGFLLDIMDSNSSHGSVRELRRGNGISNQINQTLDCSQAQAIKHAQPIDQSSTGPALELDWIDCAPVCPGLIQVRNQISYGKACDVLQ
jgi:hypothetical protein